MGQLRKRELKGSKTPVESEEQSSEETKLSVAHYNRERFKHLEGLDEDQKEIIRILASIIVKAVIEENESKQ